MKRIEADVGLIEIEGEAHAVTLHIPGPRTVVLSRAQAIELAAAILDALPRRRRPPGRGSPSQARDELRYASAFYAGLARERDGWRLCGEGATPAEVWAAGADRLYRRVGRRWVLVTTRARDRKLDKTISGPGTRGTRRAQA